MICGALNARTGCEKDFIVNDGIDHLPLYENYNVDNPPVLRHNSDVIVDSRERSLIDICIGNQLRILNGRCFGDLFGRFTCFTIVSESIIDFCFSRSLISLQHLVIVIVSCRGVFWQISIALTVNIS